MEPKTPPFELPMLPVAACGAVRLASPVRGRPAGTILVLVMAVLGLLLILGTVFITVTATDRASTANVIRATQADLAAKSAINSAVEAIRRSLFDPTGQYVLTSGIRVGPQIQYTCQDSSGNPVVKGMPDYPSAYPDPRYRGKACSANLTVGQYMDLPDPDFDYWLTSTVDGFNPPNSYEKFQLTDLPSGATAMPDLTAGTSAVLRNVARIGVPLSPNPNEWKTANYTPSYLYTDSAGRRHRDFRYPANCRNVPMFVNNQPNPDLVDVDQDGIAEGIWCVLPTAASGGEQWEAAYKVIDLSGLVNLNTAIRPVQPGTTTGTSGYTIYGETLGLMDSSVNPAETMAQALARYHTGAGTNGFLYGPFITSLYPNNLNSPTNPGAYQTIGFLNKSTPPDLQKGINTQMWSLLGVALNPAGSVMMNSFKLADELEFRYRGGITGRVPRAATSDTWPVYQTGRSNVFTLLDTLTTVSPNNPNPGIVARPYLTALSAVANYMVGDPRSTIEGTGNLTANVRDATLRGTWTANNPSSRKTDAQKSPPTKSLTSLLCDISTVTAPVPAQVERAARINTATARQFRIAMDNLVNRYISANLTAAQKTDVLTELADAFRFSLDGYIDTSNYSAYIGKAADATPTSDSVMNQLAAHLAANLISISDPGNSPVEFMYKNVAVVGIPQIPVIEYVSDDGANITLFNPWDTKIELLQDVLLVRQKVGGVDSKIGTTGISIEAYSSNTYALNPPINMDPDKADPSDPSGNTKLPVRVLLFHKDKPKLVLDGWNRDKTKTHRNVTSKPQGTVGGPFGCSGLFSPDLPGKTGLIPSICYIHLTKPHVSLLNCVYTKVPDTPYNTLTGNSSVYLAGRGRWTTPADINRIPTFGGVVPMTSGNLVYDENVYTFADQATRCQIADPSLTGEAKINFLKASTSSLITIGGQAVMPETGYDRLTPGQRFFMFFSKYDPLTDGFGSDDVSKGGAVSNPLARMENKLYGLVNINTAPLSVLKFLPWTNAPSGGSTNNDLLIPNLNRTTLAQSILNYRNRINRTDPANPTLTGSRGFLSIGELLSPTIGLRSMTQAIAGDLDYRAGNWWGATNFNSAIPPNPSGALSAVIGSGKMIGADQVRGDLAKQDLLFRNVCSMVTTRSDTFAVYAVIRSRNILTNQVSSLRWVYAIVDRSNVRNSTDPPLVYGPYDNSK